MIVQTQSAKETQQLGEKLAEKIKAGGVVFLYGDLGAGKTTLTQGIAKGLGIKNRIISPTFILVRRYLLPATSYKLQATKYFWHIDLYRLADIKEAEAIGIEEIMADKNNIVLIEWPEKIQNLLPKNHWEVKIKQVGDNEREISYEIVH